MENRESYEGEKEYQRNYSNATHEFPNQGE